MNEKTEVIYGSENTIGKGLEFLSEAKETFDNCIDYAGPSALVETKAMWEGVVKLRNSGVKVRFITEITKGNIAYCKQIMEIAELRHLEGVKGNFGIVDKTHYGGIAKVQENLPLSEWIHSTVKSFIEQQQYFFDMLWSKAISAEQKIKEIEYGIAPDFIETIRDSGEIQKVAIRLLNSAKEEILLILPSANTFHRQEYAGIMQLMEELSGSKSILHIKIMTPADYRIKDIVKRLQEQHPHQNIQIQYIQQSLETIASILVIDRKFSLSVEIKDDTQDSSDDLAIGLATYSNSKSTVLSYVSMFEGFWRQAEIYEQLKESKIQLDDAKVQLLDMKQYVNDVLKEVHDKRR
jgi:two-component system, OmpR family, sensor histidine kinase VicK